MGASDYIVTLSGTEEEVRKAWKEIQEHDRFENGHDPYNGSSTTMPGRLRFHDRRFARKCDAEEFILRTHEKRDPAMAVSFFESKPTTESDKKLTQKLTQAHQALFEKARLALSKTNDSIRKSKSRLLGCRHCGSKLAREVYLAKPKLFQVLTSYGKTLQSFGCSVCEKPLISETSLNRMAGYSTKLAAAVSKIEESLKPKPSTELRWAVGGWAAE